MSLYVGIDPGLSGAVAFIHGEKTIYIVDTPILIIKSGKKVKHFYDTGEMVTLLRAHKEVGGIVHVGLEAVHSMPKQGVASSFNFGVGYGIWQGIIVALGYSITLITPQAWKKELMAGMGKEKDASILRAKQLFPQLSQDTFITKRGRKLDGRADALLIAEYLKRKERG